MKGQRDKLLTGVFWLLLVAGICLRVHQHFFSGRPLWEDEAHLALNFMDGGYLEMFMPLKHFQSAPILFLLSVETFTHLFGFGEIALRSFPFLVSLLCYPLLYYMVRDATGSKPIALTAFALFTFNLFSIRYASELKPYIVEQSAYILLAFLLFSKNAYVSARRDKLLAVAGCIALFAANTSFIALAAIVLYRLCTTYALPKPQRKGLLKADKKLYKIWGIAFVCNIILNIIINPYADNMRETWKPMFVPFNIFSSNFLEFMAVQGNDILYNSVFLFPASNMLRMLPLILLAAGLLYMLQHKKYGWFIILVLPVCAHLFLSWVQLYPLYNRFVLYLAPALITWMAIGIKAVAGLLQGVGKGIVSSGLTIAVVITLLLPSAMKYPLPSLNILPCIDYVNSQPHDMKLFTTTTKTLYEYYYKRGYAKNGTREELRWYITPAQYMDSVRSQQNTYLLIHARNNIDGYQPIADTLKISNLVVDSMVYSDYRVLKIAPLH